MSRRDCSRNSGPTGVWHGYGSARLDESPTTGYNACNGDRDCGSVATCLGSRSVLLTTRLKPYWGKPAVRNFRGDGGNGRHGLIAVCHEARKCGYTGSYRPSPTAPPSYSTPVWLNRSSQRQRSWNCFTADLAPSRPLRRLLLPGLSCEHGFDGFRIAPSSKGKH